MTVGLTVDFGGVEVSGPTPLVAPRAGTTVVVLRAREEPEGRVTSVVVVVVVLVVIEGRWDAWEWWGVLAEGRPVVVGR